MWLQRAEPAAMHDVFSTPQHCSALPVPAPRGTFHSEGFVSDSRLSGVPKDIKQFNHLAGEGVSLQMVTYPGQAGGRYRETES
jgi:hypothetical protein